jgi:hypothetical protein
LHQHSDADDEAEGRASVGEKRHLCLRQRKGLPQASKPDAREKNSKWYHEDEQARDEPPPAQPSGRPRYDKKP